MSEPAAANLRIEVVHALPDRQIRQVLQMPAGCTAGQAVQQAGLECLWRPAGKPELPLACFGRLIKAESLLVDGDRVEILRPLLADPKDQRRLRADTARRARRRLAQGRG